MIQSLTDFVRESNRIEGILRDPTEGELEATDTFLSLSRLSVNAVQFLVNAYAPNKPLRDKLGMNVQVGDHVPPCGGEHVRVMLTGLLARINDHSLAAYEAHQQYEDLHPFMDGNGRSGRAIWLWQMGGHAPLGFLHTWYYQSLQAAR